jgi:hypothetical protein
VVKEHTTRHNQAPCHESETSRKEVVFAASTAPRRSTVQRWGLVPSEEGCNGEEGSKTRLIARVYTVIVLCNHLDLLFVHGWRGQLPQFLQCGCSSLVRQPSPTEWWDYHCVCLSLIAALLFLRSRYYPIGSFIRVACCYLVAHVDKREAVGLSLGYSVC